MFKIILPSWQVEEENNLALNDLEFLRSTGTVGSLNLLIQSQSDVTPHSATPEVKSVSES